MPWKKNKKLRARGFRDLEYLPRERSGWDCTLASYAYGVRMAVERRPPDLSAWAARHALPAGARCAELGEQALVLWHGTSRQRAEKILDHGLFHKRGLWTTVDPVIAHSFCRGRSDRFGVEGAVVCLVLDRREFTEGRDYDVEGGQNVYRFHHGLPAEAVEYLLVHEEIRFAGPRRARRPAPWPRGRFRKQSGRWVPVQTTPVRYSRSASYSSLQEFIEITTDRLLDELGEATAIDLFSTLYATVQPPDALTHEEVFALLAQRCLPCAPRSRWQTFRPAPRADDG
jgi:hypothetical protein